MTQTALRVIDIQRGAFDGVRCDPIDPPENLVTSALNLLNLLNAARGNGTPIVLGQQGAGAGAPFEEGSFHGEVHGEVHEAIAHGFAVASAEDGHSTCLWVGQSAEAIKARVNADLAQAGARLSPVADLAKSLRAIQRSPT